MYNLSSAVRWLQYNGSTQYLAIAIQAGKRAKFPISFLSFVFPTAIYGFFFFFLFVEGSKTEGSCFFTLRTANQFLFRTPSLHPDPLLIPAPYPPFPLQGRFFSQNIDNAAQSALCFQKERPFSLALLFFFVLPLRFCVGVRSHFLSLSLSFSLKKKEYYVMLKKAA